MRISNLSLGLVDTNAYFVESDNSVLLVDPLENLIKYLRN